MEITEPQDRHHPSRLQRIGRILSTGGFCLVFEKDGYDPPPEPAPPTTRAGKIAEVLATGGYSLIEQRVAQENVEVSDE